MSGPALQKCHLSFTDAGDESSAEDDGVFSANAPLPIETWYVPSCLRYDGAPVEATGKIRNVVHLISLLST